MDISGNDLIQVEALLDARDALTPNNINGTALDAMYRAFCGIRACAHDEPGKAGILADAFHNLPKLLQKGDHQACREETVRAIHALALHRKASSAAGSVDDAMPEPAVQMRAGENLLTPSWSEAAKGRDADFLVINYQSEVSATISPDFQSLPAFSGKGKSPLADAQAQAEAMLAEYRHGLEDGLKAECDRYELFCMHWLMGQKYVGLAYSVELQRAYLLYAGAGRPEPEYESIWLLDAAKELTMLMRTLVTPDQCSTAITYWGGINQRPVFAYRFKLADAPTSIKF